MSLVWTHAVPHAKVLEAGLRASRGLDCHKVLTLSMTRVAAGSRGLEPQVLRGKLALENGQSKSLFRRAESRELAGCGAMSLQLPLLCDAMCKARGTSVARRLHTALWSKTLRSRVLMRCCRTLCYMRPLESSIVARCG